MKNIVIVINTGVVEYGGLMTVMKNYLYNMDISDYKIYLLSTNKISHEFYIELSLHDINYIQLASRKKNTLSYMYQLYTLMSRKNFDIVHVNGNSATMVIELIIAKLCGIKSRIAHCHTTQSSHPLINRILSICFKKSFTYAIAVSEEAGEWIFGKSNFLVLNNAINCFKFSFNHVVRNDYRMFIDIKDKYVIGTIGKLNKPKNHSFLLDVIYELTKINKKYTLVIVGDGKERLSLEEKIKKMGIAENVILLGARKDNAELLQMMDLFLFPSKYEGFGLSLLEAQAAGLPCVVSPAIPQKAKICSNVQTLDLSVDKWVNAIVKISCKVTDRKLMSDVAIKKINENGFNIVTQANELKKVYDYLA